MKGEPFLHKKKFSYRNKIFVSYLGIITFSFIIFIFINLYRNSRNMENDVIFSAGQNFEQTHEYMEFMLKDIERTMNQIAFDEQVQTIFQRDTYIYSQDKLQQVSDSIKLSDVFFTFTSFPISNTLLYIPDEIGLSCENVNFYSLSQAIESEWYEKLQNTNHSIWFPSNYFAKTDKIPNLSIVKRIVSNSNYDQLLGIIRLEVPESTLVALLDKLTFTKNSSAMIYNKSGEIICTSSNDLWHNASYFSSIWNYYSNNLYGALSWKEQTINKTTYLIGVQSIDSTDWNLVLSIPKNDLMQPYNDARKSMIFVTLIIIPISFFMSYLLSYTNTKRISLLISHMRKVVKNDFKVELLAVDNDEIGELIYSYNRMISKISNLLNEKYLLGNQVKNLELKSLQAQINPHFLYNTLDLINWMSVNAKAPEISELVKVLSKFYRLSLSNGEDLVSLKNELEHITSYVKIQNMRFNNGITLKIDVLPEYYSYIIPKLTLQPIVENSILHGILEKEGEYGTILITACSEEDDIIIAVSDDGIGITEEKLKNLLSNSVPTSTGGFGMKNIDERVKITFGEQYGLKCDSVVGHGTTVWIRVPKKMT